MAITTYAELQTAVSNWLDRTDLTARAPEFIALAEASMQRDIRHYSMEARAALTIDGRYEDLPADWSETIRVEISKNSKNRTFKQFFVLLAYSVRGHRNRCTSHFRVEKKYIF